MACASIANNRAKHLDVQRLAFSIDELCAAAGIGRTLYERMKRKGKGPRETRIGTKVVRISRQAAEEWLAQLEAAANRTDADAAA
jgi:predicted DNA-binding transcriptional regulator AlpA